MGDAKRCAGRGVEFVSNRVFTDPSAVWYRIMFASYWVLLRNILEIVMVRNRSFPGNGGAVAREIFCDAENVLVRPVIVEPTGGSGKVRVELVVAAVPKLP
jgi:hypothetical protein